jgi:predicted ATPase/class 3 adenylate cyclase
MSVRAVAVMRETSFGRWLQRRRKALDLTQEELAQRVGCAAETLRKIEADARRPSRQIAQRLAEALELPEAERAAFIQAARAELAVARLEPPTQGVAPPTVVSVTTLPSGTITFLFTDIEGSTQLWEQHPRAMQTALARHDAIMRQVIGVYGGAVFKTTGDGLAAVFTRAADALNAALAAQRALQIEDWGTLGALRVRMALHTGAAEAHDGDYFGPPLNRVARLLAVGHGGQVLLSLATAELVRDTLAPEVRLHDLGTHRLKDLTRPEQLFQAIVPDLPAAFSPLTTLDAHPHNLPLQPTPLIDRDAEVAYVCDMLRRPETRLVTLVGPGGIGKTRLALQVAAELLDAYPSGVYFVPLAPIRDPALVVPTIAQALGVSEAGGRPLMDALRAYLRDKHLLLLLDNFEQVVVAAPLLSELLAAAPQLNVLVTSREVLHLRGEQEFPVPPLALPDPKHARLETLSQYAAVELFIARALDVNPDFAVTNESAPAVAEICARLDGLPLAIELAAARIKLFSTKALLARLEQRLALLTSGARDLPVRQQTLRNTIDWSYHLLERMEQILFQRLAVFVGDWTLEAAEAVTTFNVQTLERYNVLDGLAALVDKSLLRQTETADTEPRFEMLQTTREYALEQLAAHGETTVIEHLHADFFLALAEAAEPQLTGADQLVWMERLEVEHENLRAALGRAIERREAETALRLSGALWRFWYIRGYAEEGRAWLNSALAITMAAPSMPLSRVRATALYRAGFLTHYQGDYKQAAELCEESLALFQALGDTQGIAWAWYVLGSVALFQGDHAQAAPLLEASLTLFRELNDARGIGWALVDLGTLAQNQGNYTLARAHYEAGLVLFREVGDTRDAASCLNNLGTLAQSLGDYADAETRFTVARELFQKVGDKWSGLVCLLNLGEMAHARGEYARAKSLLVEGIKLAQDIEFKGLVAFGLTVLAAVAVAEEQHERAARLLGAAEAHDNDITATMDPVERAVYERNLATIRTHLHESVVAAAWEEGQSMSSNETIAYALETAASAAALPST